MKLYVYLNNINVDCDNFMYLITIFVPLVSIMNGSLHILDNFLCKWICVDHCQVILKGHSCIKPIYIKLWSQVYHIICIYLCIYNYYMIMVSYVNSVKCNKCEMIVLFTTSFITHFKLTLGEKANVNWNKKS